MTSRRYIITVQLIWKINCLHGWSKQRRTDPNKLDVNRTYRGQFNYIGHNTR